MTPDDPYRNRKAEDRQHIGTGRQQAEFYRQQAKPGAGVTKPAFVRTREWFEGLADEALNAGVEKVVPETLEQIGQNWIYFTLGLAEAFADVHRKNESLSSGLAGKGAQAASAASQAFAKAGAAFTDENSKVANRAISVFYAAGAVKMAARRIPPSPGYTVPTEPSGAEKVRAYAEAKAQTLDALNNILKPNFWPAGDGVPAYAPPPDIANGAGPQPGNAGPGTSGQPGSLGGHDPLKPHGVPQPAAANPGDATSAAGAGVNQLTSGPGQPSGVGSSPAPFLPSATTPANDVAGGGPYLPGGAGPHGPGRAQPQQGSGERDAQQSPVAAAVPIAPRPAAAGVPGMPGAGIPRPALRRREQEEEEQHRTPSYLITALHGSQLLGKQLKAVPPVIGAWDYENDRPIDNPRSSGAGENR